MLQRSKEFAGERLRKLIDLFAEMLEKLVHLVALGFHHLVGNFPGFLVSLVEGSIVKAASSPWRLSSICDPHGQRQTRRLPTSV